MPQVLVHQALRAPAPAPDWRREPFRIFFPLAVLIGWIGVGHWLLYTLGVTSSFSGFLHGHVMMQAFMMAFAVGFLLTAVPRRTQAAPASTLEIGIAIAALLGVVVAALWQHWALAQLAYVVLLQLAVRRFMTGGGGRRPPASFVLVPIAVAHGLGGAILIAVAAKGAAPWNIGLGRLLVEQGVFLCLAVGIGSLVLPLMSGGTPPADLGSTPGERWKALGFAALGAGIFATFMLEQAGWVRQTYFEHLGFAAALWLVGSGAWLAFVAPKLARR